MRKIITLLLFILINSCEKDVPTGISLEFRLVGESGIQRTEFSQDDSLIFEFYLSNYSGKETTYLRPCLEFGGYLNLFRENAEGEYVYYGRPVYNCVLVAIIEKIGDGDTRRVGRIPWSEEHGWPVRIPGRYYVGDTLSLSINDSIHDFVERIYFEIE